MSTEHLIGGALGLVSGVAQGIGNRNAQERSMRLAQNLNRENALFNHQLQMRLWRETNYEAQVEQMKKAGLNPALMYGSAGSAGSTQAIGAGDVSALDMKNPNYGIEGAMIGAQMDLVKAQAEKTEAEAENMRMDNEVKKTYGKDADLLEASNRKDKALSDGQFWFEMNKGVININGENIDIGGRKNYFNALEAKLKNMELEPQETEQELQKLKRNNEIGEETKEEIIQQIKYETISKNLDNLLKEANINLTKEQERKIWHDIWQGWTNAGMRGLDMIMKGAIARGLGKKANEINWGKGFKEGVETMKNK